MLMQMLSLKPKTKKSLKLKSQSKMEMNPKTNKLLKLKPIQTTMEMTFRKKMNKPTLPKLTKNPISNSQKKPPTKNKKIILNLKKEVIPRKLANLKRWTLIRPIQLRIQNLSQRSSSPTKKKKVLTLMTLCLILPSTEELILMSWIKSWVYMGSRSQSLNLPQCLQVPLNKT